MSKSCIGIGTGVGLLTSSKGRAIVRQVKYQKCEGSSIEQEEIIMETTDGRQCKMWTNIYFRSRAMLFESTKKAILDGQIKAGTEVWIEYNPKGIVAFGI